MKHFIAALFCLSVMISPALANDERAAEREKHENPLFEMGQVITCQAMHLVLAHVYMAVAVGVSLADSNADNLVEAQIELANIEMGKARAIAKIETEALIPALLARGLSPEKISQQTEQLLQATLSDLDSVLHNPLIDAQTFRQALILLQGQSATCDRFVAQSDARHTI